MPEVDGNTIATTETQQPSLGWRAGLPDDLKTNEAFVPFKTVGEFAKTYLETSQKYSEAEKKLGNSVPKLPDDATDEERGQYYEALGRPKEPSEYEFDGEDKNAPEWTNQWKQEFHSLGLTKSQAKALSQKWNGTVQKMVEAHNAKIQNEISQATADLKSEWGDKFDTNVELAKRLYRNHLGKEFDSDFDAGTEKTRSSTIKLLVKFAELTGEDRSPQGSASRTGAKESSFIKYDKSPAPPKK